MQISAEHEKTRTVTFRIDAAVLQKIKNHAKFDMITLNALVNKMLYHAISWDIPATKSGFIPVEKSILTEMLDKLDEKTIMESVQVSGKKIIEEIALTMTGNFGVRELASILTLHCQAAGFQFEKIREANTIKFVIRHQTGKKYSIFLTSFYENGFKQLGCPVEFKIAENTIVCQIPSKYFEYD